MTKRNPNWLEGGPTDEDENGPGATVDKRRLGQILGLTGYAIGEMIIRGMPVLRRGDKQTPWQFEVGRVMAWMVQDAVNALNDDSETARYREAKRAKTQAEYERIAAENAERRRELITIDEAVTLYREEAAVIRKHLGAVSAAITEALASLNPEDRRDASVVERVLEDCISAAMQAICDDNGGEHAEAA